MLKIPVPAIIAFLVSGLCAASGQTLLARGEPNALKIPIKIKAAEVRTVLLGAPGVNGKPAPVQVSISAKAEPVPNLASAEVIFASKADADFAASVAAVVKYMHSRHKGWPEGHRIVIGIDKPVQAADLPSASFAVALALDSMLGGWNTDPTCTVLGALTADGELATVESAIPRVLGCVRANAARVVMPEKMFRQVTDILVSEGPAAFAHTQFFTITGIDDAPPIASAQQSPEIVRATELFLNVEKALKAAGADADAALKGQEVKDLLREILTVAPSHMGARLLLGRTTGQYSTLSVEGSLMALEAMAGHLVKAARSRTPGDMKLLPADYVTAELARLHAGRTRLDPKAQPAIDWLLTYGETAQAWHQRPATTPVQNGERNRSLAAAARMVVEEWGKLAGPLQ